MKARASHILVPTELAAKELQERMSNGEDFAKLAVIWSQCPSRDKGGDLGEFQQGQMVPEFDKVCFNEDVGKQYIVQTQFGWHILDLKSRT